MLRVERRQRIDWVLGKVQVALAFTTVLFGAALKANLDRLESIPAIRSAVCWMQEWAWLAVILAPIGVGVVQAARRRFGNPWACESVQQLLDEFRNELFGHLKEPNHYHRVTLFKHSKFLISPSTLRCPLDWLIPVARSGHLTKAKIRKFRIPDDGDGCEGIAGRAWSCGPDWLIVPESGSTLPDPATGNSDDLARYAAATFDDEARVQERLTEARPLAQSYAAIQVLLKGRPWGVLVIDSRRADSFDAERLAKYVPFAKVLAPLLERL